MPVDLAVLAVGLVVLVLAADQFVLGSARLARLLDMPPVIVGAVVMGFGTSAPEMIVSAIAAGSGDRELGVGNIVGSNVANLSLVLGTAAFVTTMAIPKIVFRREGPLSLASALLFAAFVWDGEIERWEGVVLLVGLVAVIGYLIRSGIDEDDDEPDPEDLSLAIEIGRAVVGLIGTIAGAQLVVWAATDLADEFGVSGGFIGFSLVALGTSLPELVTTVACARRDETELIVGNLFGSNIFNSLAVGGAVGVVGPGLIDDPALIDIGIVCMVAVALFAFVTGFFGRKIGRIDGSILIVSYIAIMAVLGTADDGTVADEAPASSSSVPDPTPSSPD